MKTCSRCKESKPLESFNKRGKGHQAACKECNKEYYKNYYRTNPSEKERLTKRRAVLRKEISDYILLKKSVPCADCKVKYPYYVMDFDHLYDKKFSIGKDRNRYSLAQIKEEINKCEVVCSNCHRQRTHDRNNGE